MIKKSIKLASINLGFEATKPTKIVDKPLTSKPDPTSIWRDTLVKTYYVPSNMYLFFCVQLINFMVTTKKNNFASNITSLLDNAPNYLVLVALSKRDRYMFFLCADITN